MGAGRTINRVLNRAGLRVVRVPAGGGVTAPVSGPPGEFFPDRGPPGRWTVPPDLAGGSLPWQRVLATTYTDPASWPASVSPEAGLLLHSLVRNIQPRAVVETGTCLGVSTIWIAAALSLIGEGVIHTFDIYAEPADERLRRAALFAGRPGSVIERIREAGVIDRVRVHTGDSSAAIRAAEADLRRDGGGGVQVAFIDGDHSPAGAVSDFRAVEPLVPVGGYVFLHDTFPDVCGHLGPRHLMETIHQFAAGRWSVLDIYTFPTNYGIGVLRRTG